METVRSVSKNLPFFGVTPKDANLKLTSGLAFPVTEPWPMTLEVGTETRMLEERVKSVSGREVSKQFAGVSHHGRSGSKIYL
jgi:hypothetical protein